MPPTEWAVRVFIVQVGRLGAFPLTAAASWPAPDRPLLFSVTPIIAPGVRGKRIGEEDDGLTIPRSSHASVGTLVDTARHGEIRGPGPD